jgi:GGDEF domain-containing protein
MILVNDVGLLDKAMEMKDIDPLRPEGDLSIEEKPFIDELADLPDMPDLDLSEVDDISAGGEDDPVISESLLSELSETVESLSDEPEPFELSSSDLTPIESDSETEYTPDAMPVSVFDDETDEIIPLSDEEVILTEEKDIPELLIADSDLLPDEVPVLPEVRKTPALTLSSDDLVIPDEADAAIPEPAGTEAADPVAEPAPEVRAEESAIEPFPDRSPVLWDAAREIVKSTSTNDFFNVVILLAMGHLEASTASVIIPVKGDEQNKWILRESRGTRLSAKTITFRPSDRIMNDILASDRIVDIERYSQDQSCRTEYNLFLSVDARLAVPFRGKERVNSVLVLGNKLSGDEYSPADIAFATDLCSLASTVFDRLVLTQRLSEENASLAKKGVEAAENEALEKKFLLFSDTEAASLIQERLCSYGIDSYAFFTRTEQGEAFYPVFTEGEDLVTLRSSGFIVPATGEFCQYMLRASEWDEFENPGTSELLKKLFGDQLIVKMNIFIAVPFVVRGQLAGFMLVLRARRDLLSENAMHAPLFIRMVARHILLCESVYVDNARFVDSISRVFRRLERCIDYAAGLRIPVAAVVFSVRNMKRYCALYGASEGEELIRRFRAIIEARLSSSEFAVRTDRGKLLVLLPGKTKKYAVPFANAVRNELSSLYKERESQIMLTFMTGEFPADGKNIHELLDYLD